LSPAVIAPSSLPARGFHRAPHWCNRHWKEPCTDHPRSEQRRDKPFVVVNLATLHDGTLESELFGRERGAYTGADTRRVGKLELAQGGTVFLDEIGELPLRLQARLLEFLQSRTICPMGSNRETKLDVRVIAATHQPLQRKVRDGAFREDLFHRLRVIEIGLPSLSDLGENFGEILHSVLASVCRSGKQVLRIHPEVADRMEAYPWPGNFRELLQCPRVCRPGLLQRRDPSRGPAGVVCAAGR
jgi:DNA-binding NtrC family response regulator